MFSVEPVVKVCFEMRNEKNPLLRGFYTQNLIIEAVLITKR